MRILLCPLSDPGYLYPGLAVGRRLRDLGDEVTVLGRAAAGGAVTAAGLDFRAAEHCPGGSGFSVSRWFPDADRQYRQVLRVARIIQPDVMLTSVLSLGSLLAAEALDIPAVVLGFATHLWNYLSRAEPDAEHAQRQWRSEQLVLRYREVRERVGLPPRQDRYPEQPLHGAGLLLRGNRFLEPPNAELPPGTQYIGPCRWEPAIDPAELSAITAQVGRLGKPTAYVHLSRTFGGDSLWPRLNAAFAGGPLQAVVECGRSGEPEPASNAELIVVRKPWLSPLVLSSVLVLTSGTSAPTLAALEAGRPLVMAPAGSEQPMLTTACVRAGVAVRLPKSTEPAELHRILDRAWRDDALAAASRALAGKLRTADGAEAAARFVHSIVRTGLPQLTG